MTKKQASPAKMRSCSGIAIYGVLSKPLPKDTVTHSVVMPDDPSDLYKKLEDNQLPNQTMAFVNYYKAKNLPTKAHSCLVANRPCRRQALRH